jgi:two-component system, NarL family, sensor kinase
MLMAEALPGRKRVTLGGDKNYDTQEFVRELRGMNITPHVAQNNTNRRSAVDERTTRHAGYEVSQRKRKRVECHASAIRLRNRQTIGEKVMQLNARRIESQMRKGTILLAIEDITELRQSEKALRELSTRLMNLEDTERRRIARDVHDVTGQKISALTLNLRWLSKKVSNAESDPVLAETMALADQITDEIRGLSYILHPPMLDELGLVPALREYIGGVSERTGIEIEFDAQERHFKLPSDIEITIFRVLQDSLTNIHRHSGSATARVILNGNAGEVELQVVDFGQGMKQVRGARSGGGSTKSGVGLTSMQERLRYVGGRLQIENRKDGTTVIARIPIADTRGESMA